MFLSIRTRLLVFFLAIGLPAVGAAGWLSYFTSRSALESSFFSSLTSSRDIKKRQIEGYFESLRLQTVALANDPMIVGQAGIADGKEWRMRASRSISKHGFSDLVVISCSDLAVRIGLDETVKPGAKIFSIVGSSENLEQQVLVSCHDRVVRRPRLIDFRLSEGSQSSSSAFFVARSSLENGFSDVLVARIAVDELNRVMTGEANWVNEGFRRTGETYVVGDDLLMRSDSRFVIETPAQFLSGLRRVGVSEAVVGNIERFRSTILRLKVETQAARSAIAGLNGTEVLDDYRKMQVLSSFAKLDIPDVKWGLISEIDYAEAFAPVRALRDSLLLTTFLCVVGFTSAAALLARGLSEPIIGLVRATVRLGEGHWDERVTQKGGGEMELLAASFNQMAERLQKKSAQIARETAERARLERELLTIVERAQTRIGQELHDGLAQELLGASLLCSSLVNEVRRGEQTRMQDLEQIAQVLQQAVQMARDLARGLAPVAIISNGIVLSLQQLALATTSMARVDCQFESDDGFVCADSEVALHLYRMAQEAVANALRHGRAQKILLRLTRADAFNELLVQSDGEPFIKREFFGDQGLGLHIMAIRANSLAGHLEVSVGEHGSGCLVRCRFPLTEST